MGEGTGLEGGGGCRLLAVLNENRWFWLRADSQVGGQGGFDPSQEDGKGKHEL